MKLLIPLISCVYVINCIFSVERTNYLLRKYGGELDSAIADIVIGFPSHTVAIVFDSTLDEDLLSSLCDSLSVRGISLYIFNISTIAKLEEYFSFLADTVSKYLPIHTLHFTNEKLAEHLLMEITENSFIRRNIYYIFYWGRNDIQRYFLRNMQEAMKVILITNPRNDAYRIYFNQATSHRKHHLTMVNWWTREKRLFNHPTLPSAIDIFKDFKNRLIYVPVIHKPPWHFVIYRNDTFQVLGGRDDKLLCLIAENLKFRYEYIDPPERIQGSSFSSNGTFEGVLGLIWKREVEFFLGDVALTLERSNVVEFSFLTLADSGAFVTHAPDTLNEALALIRPFHWKVWPAIVLTFLISGPMLYVLITFPNLWQPRFLIKSRSKLLCDCIWFTTSLFLRQSEREPSNSHKSRFFIILLTIAATYVIGDMYSANLTSLLAKPGREKSINNLIQLEEAIKYEDFQLFVEKHSSTHSLLENGTGIYGRLWELMNTVQSRYLVNSVEEGVKLVKDFSDVAVIAGRETLFFDIQRFGPINFHLSEKINTAYSAIAFQLGCPYVENVNKILMAIFEAGILTKMTEDEYEKLGKQQIVEKKLEGGENSPSIAENEHRKIIEAVESRQKLKAINIRMLQGAFYLLFIGHVVAAASLLVEIIYDRHFKKIRSCQKEHFRCLRRVGRKALYYFEVIKDRLRRRFQRLLNEAIISTIEYTE
uniref:Ionotropic receptor n=1 Tax=Protaetia brevitarsis TaxID=348688 RepID=A0A411HRF0_PROBE|nr:ionotropic receptor [Protaetia brevitarsis]